MKTKEKKEKKKKKQRKISKRRSRGESESEFVPELFGGEISVGGAKKREGIHG